MENLKKWRGVRIMKKDPKFFLQARNAKKMKLNKWWKNLMKKYPFMGYGDHNYNLSIMGKDTGIAINSPRLIKKNLIKRSKDKTINITI